jgi:hypothetical protein
MNYAVRLRILIGQHSKNELLINALSNILGYGTIFKHLNKSFTTFTVSKFEDIYTKVIPLFNKYKIEGVKFLDFQYFCLAAELINRKVHLTSEGLEQLRGIKSRMNLARYK